MVVFNYNFPLRSFVFIYAGWLNIELLYDEKVCHIFSFFFFDLTGVPIESLMSGVAVYELLVINRILPYDVVWHWGKRENTEEILSVSAMNKNYIIILE